MMQAHERMNNVPNFLFLNIKISVIILIKFQCLLFCPKVCSSNGQT